MRRNEIMKLATLPVLCVVLCAGAAAFAADRGDGNLGQFCASLKTRAINFNATGQEIAAKFNGDMAKECAQILADNIQLKKKSQSLCPSAEPLECFKKIIRAHPPRSAMAENIYSELLLTTSISAAKDRARRHVEIPHYREKINLIETILTLLESIDTKRFFILTYAPSSASEQNILAKLKEGELETLNERNSKWFDLFANETPGKRDKGWQCPGPCTPAEIEIKDAFYKSFDARVGVLKSRPYAF